MKHFLLKPSTFALLLSILAFRGLAQDFVWKKGSNQVDLAGIYGTLGTSATGNNPGSRELSMSWRDNNGNFWLFGGIGFDNVGNYDYLNDLWKYDPTTNQWTWMSGTNGVNQPGIYGTQGAFAATNAPGSRQGGSAWSDGAGNLYLFGGDGYDIINNTGELNDLWVYNIALGQWKWLKGSSSCYANGVYGTLGTPAAANAPGARLGAVSWHDLSGNLWLFGGYGWATNPNSDNLNDLWRYTPSTNEWTWMKGNNVTNTLGSYGTQGTPAPANNPGARANAAGWTDLAGDLWLIGGYGYSSVGLPDLLSDFWKYTMSTGQWTWVKGYNVNTVQQGIYGTQGVPAATNLPGARYVPVTWTDGLGDLWLFGGYGFDTGALPDMLNDLWRYDIAANQWKWVKGSNATMQTGSYGIQNIPSALNMPGARGAGVSWKDGSNNLWLFGGAGYDGSGNVGDLNDMWKFFNCINPVVSIVPTNTSVCAGESVTLTATGANTYTWGGNQTTTTINVAPLGTSDYSVTGTDINDCISTGFFTLDILALPTLTTSLSNAIICAGETTTVMVTGAASYTWSGSIGTGSNVGITPGNTTTYSVTGEDANGCMNFASITQSVAACTGISSNGLFAGSVRIYPNPSNGEFAVSMEQQQAATLQIFNTLGQLVGEQALTAAETFVKLQLAKGVYNYRISNGNEAAATGKLIID